MVLRWFGGSALWFMLWWMGDMMGIVLFVFYGAGFRVVLWDFTELVQHLSEASKWISEILQDIFWELVASVEPVDPEMNSYMVRT